MMGNEISGMAMMIHRHTFLQRLPVGYRQADDWRL